MRWIQFPDGSKYTFAVDIQKFAEEYGYTVPCEANGNRHPGTDCNAKMRTVFKDSGLRRTFRVTEQSVVDVRLSDSPVTVSFSDWIIKGGLVSEAYRKVGVIQLYTLEAVNALLSVMLKSEVWYVPDNDDVYKCPVQVTKLRHNFEKKRNRPKVSLFNK